MLKSRWITAVVFGLAFSQLLQAQEQTSPAEDRAIHRQDLLDQKPSGIPIRIIEDSEDREARERSDREREQREKADLVAQQGMNAATQAMNDATQSMKWATWLSTFFVAVGTVLLVWTLILTRQANKSAQTAVKITREIGRLQTRAYLGIESATAIVEKFKFPKIRIIIKNTGMTPARNVHIEAKVLPFSIMHETEFVEGPSLSYDLGAGGCYQFEHPVGTPRGMFEFEKWLSSEDEMSVLIKVRFTDVFESSWMVEFGFSSTARDFVDNRQLLVLKSEETRQQ